MDAATAPSSADQLRAEFLHVLRRRRLNPDVSPSVELGGAMTEPVHQAPIFPGSREEGEQGRLPLLTLNLKDNITQRKPAIVILHSSYKCKEWLRPLLEAYASRGYVAIAIDSCYRGERASNSTTYKDYLLIL